MSTYIFHFVRAIHLSLILTLLITTVSCDSSSEPRTETIELSFGDTEGNFANIEDALHLEDSTRAIGQLVISANGEVTREVEWSSSDESVVTVSLVEEIAQIQAVGQGTSELTAKHKGQQITIEVSVIAPTELIIKGTSDEVKTGDEFDLSVKVKWSDASEETINSAMIDGMITWESRTEAATVSDEGEVTILSPGQVEIYATAQTLNGQEISGSWGAESVCVYPAPSGRQFNTNLELNTIFPPLKWERAHSAMDGSVVPLSMEEVYCSADFDWVKTITFMISAGWCTACPSQLRAVRDMSDELLDAGGLLVYVEVQDNQGDPADGAFAQSHLSEMLGSTNGYFVGDKETQPLTRFFGRSSALTAFPDAYVVRRSDMSILTSLDLNRQVGVLPLVRIAEAPEEDWTTIMPPPFESNCVEGDDESSEPNDTVDMAASLEAGTHSGGICSEEPDYYHINHEGNWIFRINFSHAESDIDIFQYAIGQSGGDPVTVSNGTTDEEIISGSGPAVIGVFSFSRTSATYTINLETL